MNDTCEEGGTFDPNAGEILEELYGEHARVLYNYAVRMLASADDAADAVAEVLLSAVRNPASTPPASGPTAIILISRLRTLLIRPARLSGQHPPLRDVDLWSIVASPAALHGAGAGRAPSGSPSVEITRGMVRRCGVVSSAVLSMAYFGGYRIPEIAVRLSMTAAECRSRLHGCLEHLSSGIQGGHRGSAHDVRFTVCASADALGAITAEDEPEYFAHRSGGCARCDEERATCEGVAHLLPGILPDVALPPELLDRVLFTLKVATIAESGAARQAGSATEGVEERARSEDRSLAGSVNGDDAPSPPAGACDNDRHSAASRRDRWGVLAGAVTLVALLVIATTGWYARVLSGKLDEQANLIDLLQHRQTELVVRNARLEGISSFFESNGVVTVLSGSDAFPGLSGKLVLDTTGGSAMLQIMNLPADLGRGRITVQAVREDASVRLAEFVGAGRDTGAVLYRFFPVAPGEKLLAGLVTVDAQGDDGNSPGASHRIMEGGVPLRP